MNAHERTEHLCKEAESLGMDAPSEGMIADAFADLEFNCGQEKRSLERRNSELTARISELEAEARAEFVVNEAMFDELRNALAEARKDSAIVDHLERLIKACPHARFYWTDDSDEEMPLGFSVTIEGCETSQVSGATFRECIQAEMAIDAIPATPLPETKDGQL